MSLVIAYGVIGGLGAVIFSCAAFFTGVIAVLLALPVVIGLFFRSQPRFLRALANVAFWMSIISIASGMIEVAFVWLEAGDWEYNSPFKNRELIEYYVWRTLIALAVAILTKIAICKSASQ